MPLNARPTARAALRAAASALCLAAFGAAGTAAQATELTYGSYLSPTHPVNTKGIAPFYEALEKATDGEVTGEVYYAGSMGGPKELLKAVRDNVVDSASIVDVYVKSSLPASSLAASMLILGDDPLVFAAAVNEFQLLGCPDCVEERAASDVMGLAWVSTSPYLLMCTSPISDLEHLEGRKVRATSRMGVAMQSMGAAPVSVTTAEMYEAMQRGQVDCTTGSAAWLTAYNLKDFVSSVVVDPLGSYFGFMTMDMNLYTWEDLEESQRKAIIDLMPGFVADIMWGYMEEDKTALAAAKEAGADLVPMGEDMKAAMAEMRAVEYEAAAKQGEAEGIKDAAAIVDSFRRSVEKWRGIMAEIGLDKEKYTEALRREIFSKVEY